MLRFQFSWMRADTEASAYRYSVYNTLHSIMWLVQLGPRYEGQLNPMEEPIPHEVRPLVRTHVYHPYHAADRQAETDS